MSQRAPSLETIGMTKIFGPLVALDEVSLHVEAGSFHALLGENGAGKSTLVKCIMGFYPPTRGTLLVGGSEITVKNPRDALRHGIGMVYQHFTLAPSLTAAENLVISRADAPALIDWAKEKRVLADFMSRMPFRVPLDVPVASLAAGEKQKLEILKLLYLDQRFLILDEPTSVLTPAEADEVLGLLKTMAGRGEITVLMITHKFREVTAFADSVSVLRRGAHVGSGKVGAGQVGVRKVGAGQVGDGTVGDGTVEPMSTEEMALLMIGDTELKPAAARTHLANQPNVLELAGLFAQDDEGLPAIEGISLKIKAGQILGIAGISGNGQSELVETLSGQRPLTHGRIFIKDEPFEPTRRDFARFKVFGLPEEPLKNATAPRMSVAENMAFRSFDVPPNARFGWWLSAAPMRARARELIARYGVKTPSPETAMENLSGGNVQRSVLARELSGDVDVLIVANPCFGLDFSSVTDIRGQILEQRNRGAAVLLVSEDLDEILELSDTIAVMSEGRITYQAPTGQTDRATIGRYMAGH